MQKSWNLMCLVQVVQKLLGRGGALKPPIAEGLNLPLKKIRWRITGGQKEKTDGDRWLCLNFYPCKWCEKLAGGL